MQALTEAYAQERISLFFESLNPQTRQNYSSQIPKVVSEELTAFIFKSLQEPEYAEDYLLRWINKEKNAKRLSNQSIRTYVAGVRSLLLFSNSKINEYRIRKALPKKNKSKHRVPTIEEIRKLYDILDIRGKFIVLLLVSSGCRVGAFDYFTLKDLVEFHGIGKLTVYRGEPEEYETFVTDECMNVFRQYLELRKQAGEILGPDSPLVRRHFNIDPSIKGQHRDYGPEKASTTAIEQYFDDYWRRAGIESREFKQCHGFRAFFKTSLEQTAMKTKVIERLMSHAIELELEGSYNKPIIEVIADIYKKNMSSLYISQIPELKIQLEQSEKDKQTIKEQLYIKNKILEEEMKTRDQTINLLVEELKAQRERLDKIEEEKRKELAKEKN